MASEMIEVYYQSLECISDICYYHTFFVYTDKNGNKEALRGGPSYGYNLLEYNKEFTYEVTIGKYDKSFVDHPEYDEKNSSSTYGSEYVAIGKDLSKVWNEMKVTASIIGNGNYKYSLFNQNCNTLTQYLIKKYNLKPLEYNNIGAYCAPSFMGDDMKLKLQNTKQKHNNYTKSQTNTKPYDPLVLDLNNNLKIWQDLNEDGITQTNELKTLKDLNITSINLNYKDTNQKFDNDNTITQTKESLIKLKPTQLKSA